jgi:AcrR family transcriptional regulator
MAFMSSSTPPGGGPQSGSSSGAGSGSAPIKQQRSQRTFDALVETGLRMARDRDLDAIPVAEIAKEAGYSVGAFYARFTTKDDFHRALMERYTAHRIADFDALFDSVDDEVLLTTYFKRQTERLSANRRFWRACLHRSFNDPGFWEPFRRIVRHVGDRFVERASRRIGRPLTADEERGIRFAIQVANGTINNTMINRPGPVGVDDPDFLTRLERAFRLVSDWDALR